MKGKKREDSETSGVPIPGYVPADDMTTAQMDLFSKLREDNESLQHQAETQKREIETLKDQVRDLAAGQGKKLKTPEKPPLNIYISVDNAAQRVAQSGHSPEVQARLLEKLTK